MTAVSDLPVSWAKRLADLSSWSSSRIVVRMHQSISMEHQYVKQERRHRSNHGRSASETHPAARVVAKNWLRWNKRKGSHGGRSVRSDFLLAKVFVEDEWPKWEKRG
jgi:hypothetical protein